METYNQRYEKIYNALTNRIHGIEDSEISSDLKELVIKEFRQLNEDVIDAILKEFKIYRSSANYQIDDLEDYIENFDEFEDYEDPD